MAAEERYLCRLASMFGNRPSPQARFHVRVHRQRIKDSISTPVAERASGASDTSAAAAPCAPAHSAIGHARFFSSGAAGLGYVPF